MANSLARYRAIPSSQDQAYHSDVRVAGVSGDNLYSTSESIPAEVQARAKWTYFLLGCTILLPWNGDTSRQTSRPVCA
ncbi:hypothetical protein J3R82DRAFT_10702 [Butyriboletus roseoflavus]|nr:hypothetical protein J3R82DRAFT_10702 [Butyriboletus roseoflavus]